MFQKLLDYFKSLAPANTPPSIAEQGDLLPIQERILHTIFMSGSALSIVAAALYFPGRARFGYLVFGLIYFFLAIIFMTFAFWRNSSYKLRADILLTLLFIAAVVQFSVYGFGANGGTVLLTYVILTVALFGIKRGVRATLLSVFTLAFMAFAFRSKLIPAPHAAIQWSPTSPANWLQYGIPFVMLLALTTSTISTLFKGLGVNLAQARTLSTTLENEQKRLDQLLKEGSSRLERRELQLRTASEISREFSTVLDPKTLLDKVVNSLREGFGLYYAGIFFVDDERRYAVLRAGSGEAGQKMIAAGHRLEIGGASMIGWCISNKKARIALDVGVEQVRFNNPYLPMTRSEMALPIIFHDQALGALTIQSVEPSAFFDEDIIVLQGIADSLAIALENAQLFQSTQQTLEELRLYNQAYIQDTWGRTLASRGELAFTFQNQSTNLPAGKSRALTIPVTLRDEKIGEINLETTGDALSADDHAFLDAILTRRRWHWKMPACSKRLNVAPRRNRS